ncbi:putative disease resistance protein RGA3 [Momordica charantia]|uniref:Disease resistance protein RGA3 n=1 Tax=Momordica charantia TaxID=3673 RepID=A0A6J1DBV6_MOMCH|nr:putative disease resistance protein RGA3 [Momordica charantia]
MAEFLLTFAAEEVLKKVVKVAAEQIGLAWGLEKDLEELREWLLKTEAFLRDINKRKLHSDSVRLWVDKLQDLVHEAEDLLDELVYEDLRRKVQTAKMKKVRNFLSPSNNAFVFRVKMANRMKNISDLLCKHYHEAGSLGLVASESAETEIDISQLRETVSELDDFDVVGRDVEVSSIVNQVMDATNRHVTSILPIVGMGGLGKTTLAKLVFHHERIRKHFDKTIWVCVSEPFLVNKILGAILETLRGTSDRLDNKEVLLCELKKEMHGKRYFLVLDDVWNENPSLWDELKNCLTRITEESENSILVTTRSIEVAKIMETLPSYHLSKLSDDQCWYLFQESANANGLPMTSSLKVFQEGLVKKIGGVPLVAKVLGRTVKFQGNFDIWVTILESEISTLFQEENFALSILKLSVDRLPSFSLKQCFAYCSNFPKDFVFRKDQLIQMWMAQGFIHLQEGRSNKTIEDEGDRYFKILLSRCLFQDVVKDDRGRIIECKMHDLIHDIACDVSNENKLQLDYSSNSLDGELWTKENQKLARKLRTIIYYKEMIPHIIERAIHDKMMNFFCLRVLIMNSNSIKELPNSIHKLKHLRYLDISGCVIKKLSESIVLLYNLQTLRAEDTNVLLPKNLRELISLRHLEFSYTYVVEQMPPYLSQLIQLQTLSCFLVGFGKGCKIT